jgi:hypothetical protein
MVGCVAKDHILCFAKAGHVAASRLLLCGKQTPLSTCRGVKHGPTGGYWAGLPLGSNSLTPLCQDGTMRHVGAPMLVTQAEHEAHDGPDQDTSCYGRDQDTSYGAAGCSWEQRQGH